MTTIIDFITSPILLGRHFQGESWERWRAVLRAAYSLPMADRDLALFAEVAGGRKPPARPVRELVAVVGRGGGKDSIASALAAFIAVSGDFSRLRPGERGRVMTFACDREQAAIAFNMIGAYFERDDDGRHTAFSRMVESRGGHWINLKNGASISVMTANRRAPRGRTVACAIYDECAFWYSEDYADPDVAVDAAISPGLMRFPGSLKIMISSANTRSGLLYDRFAEYFGGDDDDILVVKGASLQFNPTLDAKIIERELARDYEYASAEYLSLWRDDLTAFLDRQLVLSAVDSGVIVRPPQARFQYVAGCDPSGGRGDSMTAAIAHMEGDVAVLDALYEKRAPFDPDVAVTEIAELLRSYRCNEITGDRYAAGWCTGGFSRAATIYRPSERDKSQCFLDVQPLFTSGRCLLLDSVRVIHQFVSLQRRSTRIGRDIVCHPDHRNAHDDLANAAAIALTLGRRHLLAGPETLWVVQ